MLFYYGGVFWFHELRLNPATLFTKKYYNVFKLRAFSLGWFLRKKEVNTGFFEWRLKQSKKKLKIPPLITDHTQIDSYISRFVNKLNGAAKVRPVRKFCCKCILKEKVKEEIIFHQWFQFQNNLIWIVNI